MTHRVGAKGQVVIPKALRESRSLAPGAFVAFEERDDGVLVKPDVRPQGLRGRYQGSGLAARLLEDRAAEPK